VLEYGFHLEHPQPDVETNTEVPIKKIEKQLKGTGVQKDLEETTRE